MRERRKRSEPPVATPGLSYLPDVPLSEFAEVAVSRFKIRICVAMQVDHVRELLDPSNYRTNDDIGQYGLDIRIGCRCRRLPLPTEPRDQPDTVAD